MKLLIQTLIFFLCVFKVNGQSVFIGENKYLCSEEIMFDVCIHFKSDECDYRCMNYYRTNNSGIVFVKKNDGSGILLFSCDSQAEEYGRISGTILLYLENDEILKLYDRNKYDVSNRRATTIYYLTISEIEKLKMTNIWSIRFTIGVDYSGQTYTIENLACKYNTEVPDGTSKMVKQTIFVDPSYNKMVEKQNYKKVETNIPAFDFTEVIKNLYK